MQEGLRSLEITERPSATPDSQAVQQLRQRIELLNRELLWLTRPSECIEGAGLAEIPDPTDCPVPLLEAFRVFHLEVAQERHNLAHAKMVVIALRRLCMNAVDGKRLTRGQLKEGAANKGTLDHAIKRWHELLQSTPYFLSSQPEETEAIQRVHSYQIVPR